MMTASKNISNMIRITKNKMNYSTPSVKLTSLTLESLICQSLKFKTRVDPLENINKAVEDGDLSEPLYFEF